MAKTKLAIVGAAGRMGQMLTRLAADMSDVEVVARVDVADGFDAVVPEGTEAVIDFSFHAAAPANAKRAAEIGAAYVLGTTGLSSDEQAAVDAASATVPVVQSGNYSLGVNLLVELVKRAAQVLGKDYDVEVVEMHHKHKKDAPSGTALMLARSVAEGRGVQLEDCVCHGREGQVGERPEGEIAIHALRGGSVVGDHVVMFAGDVERVELVHKAQSREAFAAGAIRAALWAVGRKPGKYAMRDVLAV